MRSRLSGGFTAGKPQGEGGAGRGKGGCMVSQHGRPPVWTHHPGFLEPIKIEGGRETPMTSQPT